MTTSTTTLVQDSEPRSLTDEGSEPWIRSATNRPGGFLR